MAPFVLGVCAAAATVAVVFTWVAAERPVVTGVLVITLDTTRADRLSPYGLVDARMPHLDRLAREGIVFEQAATVAPLTLPAHASLFTGLLPPSHGVRDNADPPLAEKHVTLAEIFRSRGFRTAAFVGSVVLDAGRGLGQGFDEYRGVPADSSAPSQPLQRTGDAVASEAIAWLETLRGSPFFLWTHFYDPHAAYDPPEPFRSAHADPYIGEILFTDAQVGRLLDALDRLRLADRTLIVIAGDHGEGLDDHHEPTHGLFVYESVIRVPLIVRAPSMTPCRVADVVSLIDVAPTILDLAGLTGPPVDGRSLLDVMNGGTRRHTEVYAESLYPVRFGLSPYHALRDERFKFIDGPRPELFDLHRDPFEHQNLYEQRRPLAEAMRSRLGELTGPPDRPQADAAHQVSDEEVRNRLAALGYVGHAPAAGVGQRSTADVRSSAAHPASVRRQ